MSALPNARRWPQRLDVLVLAAIAALGLLHLAMPLLFDQAIFMMGAKRMAAGGALYRDFWDIKQPGIYGFYWLAGRLFGFHEVGLHLLELIVLLAASAAQQAFLRRAFDDVRTAALSPLLTWGLYYACAAPVHMTQVESLAGVPLFFALEWVLVAGAGGAALAWIAAGVAGGAALALKLVFAPLVLVVWAVGAAATPANRERAAAVGRGALLFAAGLALPVLIAIVYLASRGVLREAAYLNLGFPLTVLRRVSSLRLFMLEQGASWYFDNWSGVLGFAAFGAILAARGAQRTRVVGYALWWIVGLAVILAQRASWWAYQYELLVVPSGVLAAYGLERIAQGLARLSPAPGPRMRAAAIGAAALIAAAPMLGALAFKTALLVHERLAITARDRESFQVRADTGNEVRDIGADVAFLREPGARPGPLFVLGNALYNWLSGRDFPGPRHAGLLPANSTTEVWNAWGDDLERSRAPWVFVQDEFRNLLGRVPARGSRFTEVLAREYAYSHHSRHGDWYERRDGTAAAAR